MTVWRGALLIEGPSPDPIPQPPPLCTDLPPCNKHTGGHSNNKLQAIVHGSHFDVNVNMAANGFNKASLAMVMKGASAGPRRCNDS